MVTSTDGCEVSKMETSFISDGSLKTVTRAQFLPYYLKNNPKFGIEAMRRRVTSVILLTVLELESWLNLS